ncbi:MAG: proline racemase family protein, partial [Phycisphaerales bacterium]
MAAAPVLFVDIHTEGEPTRTIVSGGPALEGRTVAEMAGDLALRHDWFRTACIHEPRGNDVLVGALLVPPHDPTCQVGVIFFNDARVLGMCGHGTIGVVRTLLHLGRLAAAGTHTVRLDTPVGPVTATVLPGPDGVPAIEVANVRSYVMRRDVSLSLPGGRRVTGDIAWGGNSFFISKDHGERIDLPNLAVLDARCREIRDALCAAALGAIDGHPVDHVELVGPPADPANHARNYVMCPGGAYDRSPCGTGTSASLACLAARGALAPGAAWRQESVIGSVFEARYSHGPEGQVLPTLLGRAHVNLDATL